MSKRDDIGLLYRPVQLCSNGLIALFTFNVLLAFCSLSSTEWVATIGKSTAVVVSFSYAIIDIVCNVFLLYGAEQARRKSLIENGLNVDMQNEKTERYYNNDIAPSIIKICINTFESCYFSKMISGKMIISAIVRVAVAWFCLLTTFLVKADIVVVQVIGQCFFSACAVYGAIDLFAYHYRVKRTCDEFYEVFITTGIKSSQDVAIVLAAVIEYEAIKAHHKILLSPKIFDRTNKELSRQWEDMVRRVKIIENPYTDIRTRASVIQ